MHSILVVFVILLALLTLISALGGSLNLKERFEEEEPTIAEMFYEESMDEQEPPTQMPMPTPQEQTPEVPQTQESTSDIVEPFEDEEVSFGAPL
jgi:hypothetical protein